MNDQAIVPTRAEFKTLRECKSLGEAFACAEFLDRIKQSAPAHVKPQRMLRTFIQATSRTPKLLQCNMRSVLGAMLTCSEVGLEPNTLLQHAFLIPFERTKWNPETRKRESLGFEVQLIFGYPGLLDLAYRSGHVTSVHADVVWKADTFDFSYGTDAHLKHIPSGRHEPTETPLWAYAHASLTNGQAFEAMPWGDVLRVRNQTQGFQAALRAKEQGDKAAKPYVPASYTETPWVKHQEAMAKKTAFRSLSKWLPKSVELAGALALDEQQDHSSVDFGAVLDGDASISGGGFIEGEPLEQGDSDPDHREPPPLWDQVDDAHADSKPAQTRPSTRKAAAKKAAAPQEDGIPFDRWNEEGLGGDTNQPPRTDTPAPVAQTAPASEAADAGIPQTSGAVGQPVPAEASPSAEAPAAEDRSTQSPASADPAFSVWLVDGEGNELADADGVFEPFDDPVKFASAYKEVEGNLFPGDLGLFHTANEDNVQWAVSLSEEAAAIFTPAPAPAQNIEPPLKATNPTLPMAMPIDPWFIPPPTKSTRAEFTSYVDRFKSLLADAVNLSAIDHLVSVNSVTTERSDFLNSSRLQIKAATETRRNEMAAPPNQATLTTSTDLAKFKSEQLMLRVKACKTKAEAAALSKDASLVEDIRWLHANAPDIRKSTAVAMDEFVKGLP